MVLLFDAAAIFMSRRKKKKSRVFGKLMRGKIKKGIHFGGYITSLRFY